MRFESCPLRPATIYMAKHLHPISAVMLAHQYSPLLEKVIQSINWCDEIIVVTSEEVKEISDLCRRVGAKHFFRKFDGFGTQKQFAISQASHDWILSIDSDEIVSTGCQNRIETLMGTLSLDSNSAFRIQRKLVFLNEPMSFSGTPCKPIRLFNKTKAKMNSSPVHEEIETNGPVGYIQEPIYHYSYSSLDDYFFKFNRYTTLAAQELHREKKTTNSLLVWGRLPFLFLRRYLLQLGFLDGQKGFVWSVLSAWYSSVKYLKLQELNLKSKKAN